MKFSLTGPLLALSCAASLSAEAAEKSSIYAMFPNIPVTNIEVSTEFYTDVFGLKVGMIIPAGATIKDAKEVILSPTEGTFDFKKSQGLLLVHADNKPTPGERFVMKRFSVITSDLLGIEARAKAAGAEVTAAPNGLQIRFITDPDQYPIEVFQP